MTQGNALTDWLNYHKFYVLYNIQKSHSIYLCIYIVLRHSTDYIFYI